jgi:hypothetical protein
MALVSTFMATPLIRRLMKHEQLPDPDHESREAGRANS